MTQRQLSSAVTGEYSWVVGPAEAQGMSLGLTRRTEALLLSGRLEVGAVTGVVCRAVHALGSPAATARLGLKLTTAGVELDVGGNRRFSEVATGGCVVSVGLQVCALAAAAAARSCCAAAPPCAVPSRRIGAPWSKPRAGRHAGRCARRRPLPDPAVPAVVPRPAGRASRSSCGTTERGTSLSFPSSSPPTRGEGQQRLLAGSLCWLAPPQPAPAAGPPCACLAAQRASLCSASVYPLSRSASSPTHQPPILLRDWPVLLASYVLPPLLWAVGSRLVVGPLKRRVEARRWAWALFCGTAGARPPTARRPLALHDSGWECSTRLSAPRLIAALGRAAARRLPARSLTRTHARTHAGRRLSGGARQT